MTVRSKVSQILTNAKSVVFGQDQMLEAIVAALVCEGHLLIEGMPGLGKTLSVSLMSKLCSLDFKRVQFTPDLLPSDLIGTMIYNQTTQEFSTKFGPIFTQILLADEINRSPAKVQAALLEAMAEKQVTIGERSHKLKRPFVVLATQNPIEQEGTYNLPEAQLDRFMMKVYVDYPEFDAEKSILTLSHNPLENVRASLNNDDLQELRDLVEEVYVDEKVKDMIVKLVNATRPGTQYFDKKFEKFIVAGASPRASIWLYKLAKFNAFMDGQNFVNPDHVLKSVPSVLGHRVVLSYEAAMDKIDARSILMDLAKKVI